jgi:hypothetical protein
METIVNSNCEPILFRNRSHHNRVADDFIKNHPVSKRFGIVDKNLLALCLDLQYSLVGAAVLAAPERRVPFAAAEGADRERLQLKMAATGVRTP